MSDPGPEKIGDPLTGYGWLGPSSALVRRAMEMLLLCPAWQDLVAPRIPLTDLRAGSDPQVVLLPTTGDFLFRFSGVDPVEVLRDGVPVPAQATLSPRGLEVLWYPLIGCEFGTAITLPDTASLIQPVLAQVWPLAGSLIELSDSGAELPEPPWALVDAQVTARSPRSTSGYETRGRVGYELCLATPKFITEPVALRWGASVLGLLERELRQQLRSPRRFWNASLSPAGPVLRTEGDRWSGLIHIGIELEWVS